MLLLTIASLSLPRAAPPRMHAGDWVSASTGTPLPLLHMPMDKCGLLLPGESRRMVVESAEELTALEAAQFGCIGALITTPYKNVLSISTLLEVREIRRRKIGAQIDVLAVGRVHIERVESKGGRYFVAHGCRPAVDERAQDADAELKGLVNELRAAAARHEALRIGLTKAAVSAQTRDEIAARLPMGWTGTTPHYPNKGEAMEGARPEDGTAFSRPQPSRQQDRDQPEQQKDLQDQQELHHHHHHQQQQQQQQQQQRRQQQQQQQQQAPEPLERWVYKPAAWQQQQEQQWRQPQPLQPLPPPQPPPPPPQQQPLDEAREQMFEELCSYHLDQAPAMTLERLYGLWGVEDEASAEVQMLSFAACTSLSALQRSLALGKLKTSERLAYVRSCVERAASHLAAKAAIRSAFADA